MKPQASHDVTPAERIVKQRAFPSITSVQPAVLSRSFDTFFKHPFVFIGLCFLAQIPGTAANILLRNTGAGIVSTVVSFVFALIIQGAIAYGVYETLRGHSVQLGESLVSGMARFGPLTLGGLALLVSFILEASLGTMAWGSDVLIVIGSMAGILIVVLPVLLILISGIAAVLLWHQLIVFLPSYAVEFLEPISGVILTVFIMIAGILLLSSPCVRWAVFVPACVVEGLGPVESLNRSSALVKGVKVFEGFEGFSMDIFALSMKYCIGAFSFMFFGRIAMVSMVAITSSYSLFEALTMLSAIVTEPSFIVELNSPFEAVLMALITAIPVEPNSIFEAVFGMLIIAIPMAFGYVMIAVTYYELRNAREEVTYF